MNLTFLSAGWGRQDVAFVGWEGRTNCKIKLKIKIINRNELFKFNKNMLKYLKDMTDENIVFEGNHPF